MRTRNCFVVIIIGSGADARESAAVDRRNFVDRRPAAAPFAIEHASVVVRETQSFQRCFHVSMVGTDRRAVRRLTARPAVAPYQNHFRLLQYLRINAIASSITSGVISSAGRKRIEFSPARSVKTPSS